MQEHRSTSTVAPMRQHKKSIEKGRGIKPLTFKFEIILYGFSCCKIVNVEPYLCTGSGWISFKGLFVVGPDRNQVWVNIYETSM
jgi:hypothetical protein